MCVCAPPGICSIRLKAHMDTFQYTVLPYLPNTTDLFRQAAMKFKTKVHPSPQFCMAEAAPKGTKTSRREKGDQKISTRPRFYSWNTENQKKTDETVGTSPHISKGSYSKAMYFLGCLHKSETSLHSWPYCCWQGTLSICGFLFAGFSTHIGHQVFFQLLKL